MDNTDKPFPAFERLIRPATVKIYDGETVHLWMKITYKDRKLRISAVEGPLPGGECRGSYGVVDIEAKPLSGYTADDLARLRQIMKDWSGHALRPYSPEMKAAGWHKLALTEMRGYVFDRTTATYQTAERIKNEAIAALCRGETVTLPPEQIAYLVCPYEITIWVRKDEAEPASPHPLMERKRSIPSSGTVPMPWPVAPPEHKTLGWLRQKEHPDGLLCRKLNPGDKHGYGEKWWFEEVPRDVLAYLRDLPLPPAGLEPAWV